MVSKYSKKLFILFIVTKLVEILGIIPARGGSKGLKKKNIKNLAGKPLIYYTIREAKKSKFLTKLVVSTENSEISKIAKKYRIEVIHRPKNLATDSTSSISVILDSLLQLEKLQNYIPDIIVLLQPTSPLRKTSDIDKAIRLFLKGNCYSVISVSQIKHPPDWIYKINKKGTLEKYLENKEISSRQDSPELYDLNGAVFVFDKKKFMKTRKIIEKNSKAYVMSPEHSLDIDSELDLELAELIIKKKFS